MNRKSIWHSITWGITLLAILLNLIYPAVDALYQVRAQDTPPDPTPDATADAGTTPAAAADAGTTPAATADPAGAPDATAPAPTDPPPAVTDVPTDAAPTDPPPAVTDVPTDAAPTDVPPVTDVKPTDAPPVTAQTRFADDFQTGDLVNWTMTPGWALLVEGDNLALGGSSSGQTLAAAVPGVWEHLALGVQVRVEPGSTLTIAVRAAAESYSVVIDAAGVAALMRGAAVLAQGALPAADAAQGTPDALATADPNATPAATPWRQVNVQALGDNVIVAVDGVIQINYFDPQPLTLGSVIFSTTGVVALDNVVVEALAAPATPAPTDPAADVKPTDAPATDVALPTADVTPDATAVELSGDVTVIGAVPTADATADAAQPTPDATAAAVADSALVPVVLPVDGTPVLSDDFSGDLSLWATDAALTDGALTFGAGNTLAPTAALYLADFQLRAALTLTEDGGFSLFFRQDADGGYRLDVSSTQVALYRGDTLLTSAPVTLALGTRYALSLTAQGSSIVASFDGTAALTYVDETPAVGGTFALTALGALTLDDVVVGDLTPLVVVDAAPTTPTPAPFALSDAARAKLPGALAAILDAFAAGNVALVQELAAQNGIAIADDNTAVLLVWAAPGVAPQALAELVASIGGGVLAVNADHVEARLNFAALAALATLPEIGTITPPFVASSTGFGGSDLSQVADLPGAPIADQTAPWGGTVLSRGYNTVGAHSWYDFGTRGANVDVAVIDTGFAGVVASSGVGTSDYRCAYNAPGGTAVHGASVVQVICDIAPDARVYGHLAANATDMLARLNTILNSTAPVYEMILITMDLGVAVSRGDGTDGDGTYDGGLTNQPTIYDAIRKARELGMLVLVSAGNNTGRYQSFTSSGAASVLVLDNVRPNSTLNVNWSNAGNITVSLSGTVSSSQSARPGSNGYQFTIGACTDIAPADGICDTDLTITVTATVGYVVQVQASAGDLGTPSTGTLLSGAGTLGRPADSPYATTVGAVCGNPALAGNGDMNILGESSIGPVFTADGAGAATGVARDAFKPDFVAPSLVNTTQATKLIDDCTDFDDNVVTPTAANRVFRGTSAAAAHAAGMAALLLSSTPLNDAANRPAERTLVGYAPSGTQADRVEAYLQAHAADQPFGAPDGFDRVYGAGLAVLGNPNPTYDINSAITFAAEGTAFCPAGNLLYVNPSFVASVDLNATLGTISNPYPNVGDALADATSTQCVVLMPGEYSTPVYISNTMAAKSLVSYDLLTSITFPGSYFWVLNSVLGSASEKAGVAVYRNDIVVDGFNFLPAAVHDPQATAFSLPRAYVYDNVGNNAAGGGLNNSTFTNFRTPVLLYDVGTSGSDFVLSGNTFSGFVAPDSSTAVLWAQVITGKNYLTVQYNTFSGSTGAAQLNSGTATWYPVVQIEQTRLNMYNNTFSANVAQALINVLNNDNGSTTDEVRFFGNLFVDNDLKAFGTTPAFGKAGPIVHVNKARNFRFINNTLINNQWDSSNGSNTSIIAQNQTATLGGIRFEVHNNLIWNNARYTLSGSTRVFDLATQMQLLLNGDGQSSCDSINSPAGENMRGNWVYDTAPRGVLQYTAISGCNSVITAGGNFNVLQAAGQGAINVNVFFGATFDPANPWRVRPYWADTVSGGLLKCDGTAATGSGDACIPAGLDAGHDGALSAIGYSDISTDRRQTGSIRVADSLATNPTQCTASPCVDIGAYELELPDPVVVGSVLQTMAEDNGVVGVNPPSSFITFNLNATGGYPPYNFTITSAPTNYDPSPTNPCFGQPIYIDPLTRAARYCPPKNFYNYSGSLITAAAAVDFTYSASDIIGQTDDGGTGSIRVTPVNDGAPVSPGTQNIVVDFGTQINYALRPTFQFANFVGPDTTIGVDYDFDFISVTNVSVTGQGAELFGVDQTATVNAISAELAASGGISGDYVMTLTPTIGKIGVIQFDYTIRDFDNQTTTATMRIEVTRRIATAGLHDDASLDFRYSLLNGENQWTGLYLLNQINNTVHRTTAVAPTLAADQGGDLNLGPTGAVPPASLEFQFSGDTFVLHYQDVPGYALMEIWVDLDGDRNYDLINTAAGTLTCRHSQLPTPLDIGGAGSPTGYYQGSGRFNTGLYNNPLATLSCTGFESGGNVGRPHGIIVRNVYLGVTPIARTLSIDAIAIRSGILGPGVYEDNFVDFNLQPSTAWSAVYYPALASGNYYYRGFNATNTATLTFTVDGDLVDGLVIQRFVCATCADVRLTINGQNRGTLTGAGLNVLTPFVFDSLNLPSGTNTVVLSIVGGQPANRTMDIDYVQLLPQRITMTQTGGTLNDGTGAGPFYEENSAELVYIGRWATRTAATYYAGPNLSPNGSIITTNDLNARLRFQVNGSGFIVKRAVGAAYGSLNICVYTNANFSSGLVGCRVTPYMSVVQAFGDPFAWRLPNAGLYYVEIRPLNTITIGVDGVEVLGNAPTLSPANAFLYQDMSDPALTFVGNWTPFWTTAANGGTYMRANLTTTNQPVTTNLLRFTVPGSTTITNQVGIVVYVQTCPTCADLQVVNVSHNQVLGTIPGVGAGLYGQPFVFFNNPPGADSSPDIIEVRYAPGNPATRPYFHVDGVQLVSALAAGTYQDNDSRLSYVGGPWTDVTVNVPPSTNIRQTIYASAIMRFVATDSFGVRFNRINGGIYAANINVCINNVCRMSGAVGGATFLQSFTYRMPAQGNYVVEIRTLGGYASIDSIEVLGALPVLPPNVPAQDNGDSVVLIAPAATAPWTAPIANLYYSGGTYTQSSYQNSAVRFTLNTTNGFIVYRNSNGIIGVYDSGDSFVTQRCTIPAGTTPFYVTNGASGTCPNLTDGASITVELRMTSITGFYWQFDAVTPLPAAAPSVIDELAGVVNVASSPDIIRLGTWATSGTLLTTTEFVGELRFKMTGRSLTIYRSNTATDAPYQVCFYQNNPSGSTIPTNTTYTIANYATTNNAAVSCRTVYATTTAVNVVTPFAFPYTASGTYFVSIKSLGLTRLAIESIEVSASLPPLQGPTLYQNSSTLLTYGAGWVLVGGGSGGTMQYTATQGNPVSGTNGQITFIVDGDTANALLVFYRQCPTCGDLIVEWDENTTSPTYPNNFTLPGVNGTITRDSVPGLVQLTGLAGGERAIVRIRSSLVLPPGTPVRNIVYFDGVQPINFSTYTGTISAGTYDLAPGVPPAQMTFLGDWQIDTAGGMYYTTDSFAALRFGIASSQMVTVNRFNGISNSTFTVCLYTDSTYTTFATGNQFTSCRTSTVGTTTTSPVSVFANTQGLYYVEIRNTLPYRMGIDSIQVSTTPLTLTSNAVAQENSPAVLLTNNASTAAAWAAVGTPLATGGLYQQSVISSATVRFAVNGFSDRGFIVYRNTCSNCVDLGVYDMTGGGTGTLVATLTNITTTTLYAQPFVVFDPAGLAGNRVVYEIRPVNFNTPAGRVVGTIDGIQPIPNAMAAVPPVLPVGSYNYTAIPGSVLLLGSWQADGTALVQFSTDLPAAMRFELPASAVGVRVTRQNAYGQGTFDVCFYSNDTFAVAAQVECRRSTSLTTAGNSQVLVLMPNAATRWVEIRNTSTLRVGVASIDVLDLPALASLSIALDPANGIYQETHPNLYQSGPLGAWVPIANGTASGAAQAYTVNTAAELRFALTNPSGGDVSFAVFAQRAAGFANMQVIRVDNCGTYPTGCTVINPIAGMNDNNATAPLGMAQPIVYTDTGFGAGTARIYEIRIETTAAPLYVDGITVLPYNTPYPSGLPVNVTVEEDDSRLLYVGAWQTGTGNRFTTEWAGGIRFVTGGGATGVVINRTNGVGQGSFNVCFYSDPAFTTFAFGTPTPNATASCRASTAATNDAVTPFVFNPTTVGGTYYVAITNLSGIRYGIDSIQVINTLPTLPNGLMVQETSPYLTPSAGWIPAANSYAAGAAMSYTVTNGSTYMLLIDPVLTNTLVVYAQTCAVCARFEVWWDSNFSGSLETSGGSPDTQLPSLDFNTTTTLYAQRFLVDLTTVTEGRLWLRAVTTGLTPATRTQVWFDGVQALSVTPPEAAGWYTPIAGGTVPNTDARIRYFGAWSDDGALRFTTQQNAVARFAVSAVANSRVGVSVVRGNGVNNGTLELCFYSDPTFTTLVGTAANACRTVLVNGTPSGAISHWIATTAATTYYVQLRSTGLATRLALGDVTVLDQLSDLDTLLPDTLYQQNDGFFTYTGTWTGDIVPTAGGTALGTTIRRSTDAMGRVRFTLPNASNVPSLLIYRETCLTCGDMQLWDVTNPAVPVYLAYISGYSVTHLQAQPFQYTFALTLPSVANQGARVLELRNANIAGRTTGVSLDAIEVRHQYEDAQTSLAFVGAWTSAVNGGYFGYSGRTTITNGDTLAFKFTGTGFILFGERWVTGGQLNVCYEVVGGSGGPVCLNTLGMPNRTQDFIGAQPRYGFAYYGLDHGTYIVTISNVVSGADNRMSVDSLVILGALPATPMTAGVRADDVLPNSAGAQLMTFAPGGVWTRLVNNTIYYGNGTQSQTTQAGAVVMLQAPGNYLTIYQQLGGAVDLRFCTILDVPGNASTTPSTAMGVVDCSNYAQGGGGGLVMPIVLYGFGTNTHGVVIENRVYGGLFTVDAVRPDVP